MPALYVIVVVNDKKTIKAPTYTCLEAQAKLLIKRSPSDLFVTAALCISAESFHVIEFHTPQLLPYQNRLDQRNKSFLHIRIPTTSVLCAINDHCILTSEPMLRRLGCEDTSFGQSNSCLPSSWSILSESLKKMSLCSFWATSH